MIVDTLIRSYKSIFVVFLLMACALLLAIGGAAIYDIAEWIYSMVALAVIVACILLWAVAAKPVGPRRGMVFVAAAFSYFAFLTLMRERLDENIATALLGFVTLNVLIAILGKNWRSVSTAPILAKIGMSILAAYVMIAVLAGIIAPYGEAEVAGAPYETWSWLHLLGTDSIGRDMLSRLLYGARNTISLALAATTIGFLIGAFIGMFAAVVGGYVDIVFGRVVDILMAVPQLILALLVLTVVGPSSVSIVLVIALVDSTRVFRLSRSLALDVMALDFIEVARARGEGVLWIMRKELLPNIIDPLVVEFGIRFCFVFLFISTLSFLGLGIQPPTADWGSMVRESSALIAYGEITPLLPAVAIAVLVVGANLTIDWLMGAK